MNCPLLISESDQRDCKAALVGIRLEAERAKGVNLSFTIPRTFVWGQPNPTMSKFDALFDSMDKLERDLFPEDYSDTSKAGHSAENKHLLGGTDEEDEGT